MLWQFYIIFILVWVGISRWRKRKLINLSKHLRSEVPCLPIVGHAYKFFGNDEGELAWIIFPVPLRHATAEYFTLQRVENGLSAVVALIGRVTSIFQMQGYQQFGREAIQHGGLTSVWIGYFLGVFVGDPIDAEFILKNYMDKGALMAIVRSAIGNGSVFAPVSIWRPRRKILAPTFSLKNVQNFSKVFTRQTAVMVEQLRSKVGSGPFSIWNYFTTYTTDTACGKYFHSGEIFLGIDLKSQQEGGHPFLRHFEINKVLMATRLNSPWLHSDFIYKLLPSYRTLERSKKYIYTFIEDIIRLRRKEIYATASSKKSCSSDFLEMLIELSGNDSGYTVEELREEILVAIIAGSDTSAVASSFTTLMLARHPDVQEKVYQELKEVIGDSAGPVTQADIPHLKYLEAVIKETIRLYPPSPVFLRESDRDLTLPSGTTIVKGCVLVLNTWAMHRNPKYWGPDAEEFRPERWLDTPFKHPAQFMAFSYGPRNCLGYQFAITSLKINLASLLLRYRILPDRPATGDGSRLHKPLKLKFNITMKDVDNFIVQLENRI